MGITQARRLVAAYDSDANGSLSAEELANATTEGAVILLDGGGIAIDMNVLLTSAIATTNRLINILAQLPGEGPCTADQIREAMATMGYRFEASDAELLRLMGPDMAMTRDELTAAIASGRFDFGDFVTRVAPDIRDDTTIPLKSHWDRFKEFMGLPPWL